MMVSVMAEQPKAATVQARIMAEETAGRRGGPVSRPSKGLSFINAVTPSWDPQSLQVASNWAIWKVAEGASPQKVVTLPDTALPMGWSPDGKEFAFLKLKFKDIKVGRKTASVHEPLPDLYVTNDLKPASGKLIARNVLSAVWSPKGERLAIYQTDQRDPTSPWRAVLAIVDKASGSAIRLDELTLGIFSIPIEPPAWSPDGKTIAYVKEDDEIWLTNVDGSQRRQLTHIGPKYFAHYLQALKWATDGKSIKFLLSDRTIITYPVAIPQYLCSVDVQTGEITYNSQDLTPETHFIYAATWSPDASRVVLLVYGENMEVWVTREDGTGLAQVASHKGGLPREKDLPHRDMFWQSWGVHQAQPAWSPDGKRIAYMHPSALGKLYVLTLDDCS
jgi:Tol biopolymer transport system component